MRAVIHFVTRKSRGETAVRETIAEGEHIIAGRGNDCGLHLPDPRVLLHHAEFSMRTGALYVTAVAGGDLRISGNLAEGGRVVVGQKIRIGPYEATVEEPPSGADMALAVELVQPLGNDLEQLVARSRIEITRIGLTMRAWSWLFAAAVIALALLTPLILNLFMPAPPGAKALNPFNGRPPGAPTVAWTSGPLSPAHKFFGDNCATCHPKAFATVPDSACLACHGDVHYHADPALFPLTAFGKSECQDCHKEHHGNVSITGRDARFCTACHSDLERTAKGTTLRNVSDFANHAEFRPTVFVNPVTHRTDRTHALTDSPAPQQNTGLKFPHDKHMLATGVRDGNGAMVKLTCASCHVPDSTGIAMQPVSFERDCHGCHQMKFDARVPDRELMHVKAADVFKQVRDVYDALALHGGYDEPEAPAIVRRRPGVPLNVAEKKIVGDWATAKAMQVLDGRFGKGLCAECHAVIDQPVATDAPAGPNWTVTPVILNASFFPNANFTHAKHASTACRYCHDAEKSVSLSEVIMPPIAVCRSCHGGEKATDLVPSTCTDCHSFHRNGKVQVRHLAPSGDTATQASQATP